MGQTKLTRADVMSECLKPKKTKAELEQIIKSNGGKILQSEHAAANTICIADRGKIHLCDAAIP